MGIKKGSLLGAVLLVAGTAIGGGMLALPVLTCQGGFFPASLLLCLSWLFMAATGTLLVEVYLWHKREVNLVSMAGTTLGRVGQVAAWILYIFLFYSLTTAYIAGGGNLVGDLSSLIGGEKLAAIWGPLIFLALFVPFVVIGASAVDRINRIFVAGLFLSFFIFLILGSFSIDFKQLTHANFAGLSKALLVVFTSFGYQGIVPTLVGYLGRDGVRTRKAIWIGTAIPLLIYLIWEMMILGVIPLPGLEDALSCGQSAVYPLKEHLGLGWLYGVGEAFAFFAIVTSFLGVTLGLTDFFSDGLKIEKRGIRRALLALLVFLPPLIFVLINPCLFLMALNWGGGLGCALLLGLLPILMAWSGRYSKKFTGKQFLGGGRPILLLLLLYFLFIAVAAIATL